MVSLLAALVGGLIAAAVVIVVWSFLGFIDEMSRAARRRGRA